MIERLNYGSLTLTESERDEIINLLMGAEAIESVMGTYNLYDAKDLEDFLSDAAEHEDALSNSADKLMGLTTLLGDVSNELKAVAKRIEEEMK